MSIMRALGLVAAASMSAGAQASAWHSVVEANANVQFGASSQTIMTTMGGVSHRGDNFVSDAMLRFQYGESEDAQKVKFVSKRGWTATVSADGMPKGTFSPFFFANGLSSLEQRITTRFSGGAGAKYVFSTWHTGAANLSLAMLGERTVARADTAVAPVTLARWSYRLKADQKIGEVTRLAHIMFYAPVVNHPGEYTITSTSDASVAITHSVALILTLQDNYDSEARARGALSNNSGFLLFGFRGTW